MRRLRQRRNVADVWSTSVFIPAKEILSNAWNLDATVKMGNVEFDDTYLDIIAAAKIDISKGVDSAARKNIWIFYKNQFWKVTKRWQILPETTQAKLEFNLVAEGLRKIAQQLRVARWKKLICIILGWTRSKYQSEIYSCAGWIADYAGKWGSIHFFI